MFRLDLPRPPRISVRLRPTRPELLLGLAAVALVFASVWSQSRVDRLRLELAEQTESLGALERRAEFLARDLSRSRGLEEVEGRAVVDLGLTTPSPENVVLLRFEPGAVDGPGRPRFDGFVPEAYAEPRRPGRGDRR